MDKKEIIRKNINSSVGPLFYYNVQNFLEKRKPGKDYFRLVTVPANHDVPSFHPKEIEKITRRNRKSFLVLDGQTVRVPNDYEKKVIREELKKFNEFYLAEKV